jgi:hypothetical protein
MGCQTCLFVVKVNGRRQTIALACAGADSYLPTTPKDTSWALSVPEEGGEGILVQLLGRQWRKHRRRRDEDLTTKKNKQTNKRTAV